VLELFARENKTEMSEAFRRFARCVDALTAHPVATAIASALIVAWAVSGRYFHFSDTWQLVANTVSSLVTFLMVFIIANAQKRDTNALNLKLDILIAAHSDLGARAVGLESAPEVQVAELRAEVDALAGRNSIIRPVSVSASRRVSKRTSARPQE
jgi:low affinity Fe/Cu permease